MVLYGFLLTEISDKALKECRARSDCKYLQADLYSTTSMKLMYVCKWQDKGYPITRQQNFRLVQIETNCRRHFKVNLKWKISTL